MARKSTPQPLTLPNPVVDVEAIDFMNKSTLSPKSPKTPKSPFRFTNSKKLPTEEPTQSTESIPQSQSTLPQTSATVPSLAQHAGGQENTKQEQKERSSRSGFFSNYKAAKSSSKLQNENTAKQVLQEENMSRDTDQLAMAGRVSSKETPKTEPSADKPVTRRPVGGHSKTESSLELPLDSNSSANANKKSKPKPFSLLSRTKSLRDDPSSIETSPIENITEQPEKTDTPSEAKTAPLLEGDRSFRSMMASTVRQHSADRVPRIQRDRSREQKEKRPKEGAMHGRSQTVLNLSSREHSRNPTSLSTSASGHTFLNSLKSSAMKGAGGLSKAVFGKSGRSGSTTERAPEVTDEHYQLKVLNLPLVEQTRLTRISKKLEDSRDKTEFWMPSFPWRAIDYLNYKGSEEEGLYRVPGAHPSVKMWQRRFDEQLDIDFFEQSDLYDINIIGSMLKAWLRELPDDILPRDVQDRVIAEAQHLGVETDVVPPILIEELSNLPPFNYYLLFAITCHLSLLLQHKAKNKMDYKNLCICFQPALRVDHFCFKFLVVNWRDCWKGCKTESFYVEQEYIFLDQVGMLLPPSSAEGRSSTAVESSHEERNVSSSDSSKPSSVAVVPGESLSHNRQDNTSSSHVRQENANGNNRYEGNIPTIKAENQSKNVISNGQLPLAQPPGISNTISTTLTVIDERDRNFRRNNTLGGTGGDMRPLSPIKPLSPLNF